MLVTQINDEERNSYLNCYADDAFFSVVLKELRDGAVPEFKSKHSQYFVGDDGLLYFEDWQGGARLCVPHQKRVELMTEAHEIITEGAHSGYERTYNRIAQTYYWPRMSEFVRRYVNGCEVC